jgi:hypothetical protein
MQTLPPQIFAELRSREYCIRLITIASRTGQRVFSSRQYRIADVRDDSLATAERGTI